MKKEIRVKLTDKCQLNCSFCHREGVDKTKDMSLKDILCYLTKLENKSIERVHLTGGEPTSHPEIVEIIRVISEKGIIVEIVTNGVFDKKLLKKMQDASLKEITFSLHTLNPKTFLKIQRKRKLKEAETILALVKRNIIEAKKLFKEVYINAVMTDKNIGEMEAILNFCVKNSLEIRFLTELGTKNHSLAKKLIIEKLKQLGAKYIGKKTKRKSSKTKEIYNLNGKKIFFKNNREYFHPVYCKDCNKKRSGECQEGFYEMRIEGNPLKERFCLYKKM